MTHGHRQAPLAQSLHTGGSRGRLLSPTDERYMRYLLEDEKLPDEARQGIYIAFTILYGLGFIALIVAFWHRQYPPLKVKHLPLLSTAYVASFLWFIGVMQTNGFFTYQGPWSLCILWGVWVQWIFGLCLVLGVLTLRLYTLFHVFVRRRAISDQRFILPFLVAGTPVLGVGFFSLFAPPTWTDYLDPRHGDCRFNPYFSLVLLIFTVFFLLILGWFTWALRGIRQGFNEFNETRIGYLMYVVTFILNGTFILKRWTFHLWGKYTLVIVNLLVGNIYFWLVITPPLFGCLFRREAYLMRFVMALNAEDSADDGGGGEGGGGDGRERGEGWTSHPEDGRAQGEWDMEKYGPRSYPRASAPSTGTTTVRQLERHDSRLRVPLPAMINRWPSITTNSSRQSESRSTRGASHRSGRSESHATTNGMINEDTAVPPPPLRVIGGKKRVGTYASDGPGIDVDPSLPWIPLPASCVGHAGEEDGAYQAMVDARRVRAMSADRVI